jgi:hypothetical protein
MSNPPDPAGDEALAADVAALRDRIVADAEGKDAAAHELEQLGADIAGLKKRIERFSDRKRVAGDG